MVSTTIITNNPKPIKAITLRVSQELSEKMQQEAIKENRTLTNYIETILMRYHNPPKKR